MSYSLLGIFNAEEQAVNVWSIKKKSVSCIDIMVFQMFDHTSVYPDVI